MQAQGGLRGVLQEGRGHSEVLEEGRLMVLLWEPGAVGAQPSHFTEAPLHGPAKALSPPGALVSSF